MIPSLRDNAPHHIRSQRLWDVFLKRLFAQIGKATNAGVVRSMRKSKEKGEEETFRHFSQMMKGEVL
jgi:hypothetical protein